MSKLLKFDINTLNSVLDKYGLELSWINILATHIYDKPEFQYILKDVRFKRYTILDNDMIKSLSIGDISILYEYCLSYINHEERKKNGQFFTPDDVACLMAKQSLKFDDGVWLDPCSGIGNLSWYLVNLQEDKEFFIKERLVLSDTDELALFIARVLFTVSFQQNDSNLFNSIKSRFILFDFLSVADSRKNELFETNTLSLIPKHDYVIVNPPYLATDEKPQFETAKCCDLYAYFLENIIKTSIGFISITPQSFTNAEKFYSLRVLLLNKMSEITIYNFDNVPDTIFHGIKFGSKNTNTANSIRASITVATNKSSEKKITSLLRWQTAERQKMLDNIDLFLSEVELTPDFFPKVNRVMISVYNTLDKTKKLGDIISNKPTEFVLYIPSTPRYFITALKHRVNRSSLKTIYFSNQEDLDYAYCLINSSLMYWWWRVRDGGMTLSLETISSLPLVKYNVNSDIVHQLELSEQVNKVYKNNCGVTQENVKHPMDLLYVLNQSIVPDYCDLFIPIHKNSEFKQLNVA